MNKENLLIGNSYNWKCDDNIELIYIGYNFSGNGYWHQFKRADNIDGPIWCEVKTDDLDLMEEYKNENAH